MIQERKSHGWEGGISTPAGLPRWGHRLASAQVESLQEAGVNHLPNREPFKLEFFLLRL
jgi:hypothetical protein